MQEKELPKACVFDAYGTLFDYASAAARFGETLGPRWELLSTLWREKQLQYTWLRTIQDKHSDFWQVTGDALDFALEAVGIEAAALRGKLMDAYWTLDAFPEVPDVLERLKRKRIKTAILSNGSPEMLRSAVTQAGLTGLLDEVLSIEEASTSRIPRFTSSRSIA
jgi:2-haloacid dehalogenase